MEAGKITTRQALSMDRDSILDRMAEPVWNAYNDHSHGPGPWKLCRTSPHTRESVQEHLADAALALDASGLMERIAVLEAERDEADRRAGAAERAISNLKDTVSRLDRSRDKAKVEAGYSTGVSFDVVWAETLEKARRVEGLETVLSENLDLLKSFMEERGQAASKISGCGGLKTRLDDGTYRVNSSLYGTEEALREYERYCPGVFDLLVRDVVRRLEAALSPAPSDSEAA